MKIIKSLSPFILLLIIGAISFRFLFFISYIKGQKSDFRKQILSENTKDLKLVKFSNDDVFKNKNGFEWKEHNKELKQYWLLAFINNLSIYLSNMRT